jgi:adenosylhomocysteinase
LTASLEAYFAEPTHASERATLPLLQELVDRYSVERPLTGQTVIFGHALARNSMVMVEALNAAGAKVILTEANPSPAEAPVREILARLQIPVASVSDGVRQGDVYLDVAAVLARARPPQMAAEVTRSGTDYYRELNVPVVNADQSRCKLIEGFFGTGESFLRAWRLLRPESPNAGKRLVLLGYGKIGRGVAFRTRQAGLEVTVIDKAPLAVSRAHADGFKALDLSLGSELRHALERADIVVSVTGVRGSVGSHLPKEWLCQGAALVNLGAEDEFGPEFTDDEILGGKRFPLNFHLEQPTLNRYVDAPLAGHLLALESLIKRPRDFGPGVHPLPEEQDEWVVRRWREHHPEEDLTGIRVDLGL